MTVELQQIHPVFSVLLSFVSDLYAAALLKYLRRHRRVVLVAIYFSTCRHLDALPKWSLHVAWAQVLFALRGYRI
ncbi:hypothetical protein EV127DRAFT_424743 [Xylaria flabelliformis]|nr:hypothetical protein EV127DRAFT_424743 [Xylaria flabelliformis]